MSIPAEANEHVGQSAALKRPLEDVATPAPAGATEQAADVSNTASAVEGANNTSESTVGSEETAAKKAKIEGAESVEAKVEVEVPTEVSTEVKQEDETSNRIVNPRIKMSFLPKYCGKKDIEKVLKKCEVKSFGTIKKSPKWDYCFIAFKESADRDDALAKLQGQTMKEKPFQVESFDMERSVEFFQKRQGNNERRGGNEGSNNGEEKESSEPVDHYKKLSSKVTPLADMDYVEQQLREKRQKLRKSIVRFTKDLQKYLPREFGNRHHEWPVFDVEEVRSSVSGLEPQERAIRQLSWLGPAMKENGGACCPVEDTVPSPIVDGYRNKCEFSFGFNPDGKKTLGFMLGLFREGIVSVLEPSQCKNISTLSKEIVAKMQEYLDKSDLEIYDRVKADGFWRLLVTRTMKSGENMVLIQVKPLPEAEKEKQDKILEELKELFSAPELGVTTLIIQFFDGVSNGISEQAPNQILFGEGVVTEELLGLKFRIGPVSFFQVNTEGAEVLYTKIRELCELSEVERERMTTGFRKVDTASYMAKPKEQVKPATEETAVKTEEVDVKTEETPIKAEKTPVKTEEKPAERKEYVVGNHKDKSAPGTVVLDLCCGTGTIGLTMAGHVKKVIGVDIVESAVRDACFNAKLNNINARILANKRKEQQTTEVVKDEEGVAKVASENIPTEQADSAIAGYRKDVVYIADKAENAIKRIIREEVGPRDDVVAILDPPRNGCHADVIRAIRDCSGVDRVVFASCDADQAIQNFVDLCRPTSNKFKGLPFVPKNAVPVDLFPHTKLCELLVTFRRLGGRLI